MRGLDMMYMKQIYLVCGIECNIGTKGIEL